MKKYYRLTALLMVLLMLVNISASATTEGISLDDFVMDEYQQITKAATAPAPEDDCGTNNPYCNLLLQILQKTNPQDRYGEIMNVTDGALLQGAMEHYKAHADAHGGEGQLCLCYVPAIEPGSPSHDVACPWAFHKLTLEEQIAILAMHAGSEEDYLALLSAEQKADLESYYAALSEPDECDGVECGYNELKAMSGAKRHEMLVGWINTPDADVDNKYAAFTRHLVQYHPNATEFCICNAVGTQYQANHDILGYGSLNHLTSGDTWDWANQIGNPCPWHFSQIPATDKLAVYNTMSEEDKLIAFAYLTTEEKIIVFNTMSPEAGAALFATLELQDKIDIFKALTSEEQMNLFSRLSDADRLSVFDYLSQADQLKVLNDETLTTSEQKAAYLDKVPALKDKADRWNVTEYSVPVEEDAEASLNIQVPAGVFGEGVDYILSAQTGTLSESEQAAITAAVPAGIHGVATFDISFLNAADNSKLQPVNGTVELTFTVDTADLEGTNLLVYHLKDNGDGAYTAELKLTQPIDRTQTTQTLTVQADSFSSFFAGAECDGKSCDLNNGATYSYEAYMKLTTNEERRTYLNALYDSTVGEDATTDLEDFLIHLLAYHPDAMEVTCNCGTYPIPEIGSEEHTTAGCPWGSEAADVLLANVQAKHGADAVNAWVKTGAVTNEMLELALTANSLHSVVILSDTVMYLYTGDIIATLDETNQLIDARYHIPVAQYDPDTKLITSLY